MTVSSRGWNNRFEIIDRNSVDSSWNGLPQTLQPDQNINMPKTPNGTMVFAYFNQSLQNNQGQLSVTSGGNQPDFLQVPALAKQPGVWTNNWKANNLSVTNTSGNTNTPIWVAAFGPGVPGQNPVKLPTNGTAVPLVTAQSAQGTALPQYMQLLMQSNSSMLTVFAVIGGPADARGNNGYVIAVNAGANTGPGTGQSPPDGYYATATGNSYPFPFNWGSSSVYVVNLSPATAAAASVVLRAL